jgi:hypothetical protein
MDSYTSPLMVAIYAIIAILGVAVLAGVVLPQVPTRSIANLFLGIETPPILVAFLRRGATALITLLVTAIARRIGMDDPKEIVAVVGAIWGVAELAWGGLDQAKKSGQNDYNPKPVAGGGIPDLPN